MTNIGINADAMQAANGAKHGFVDEYPYLVYAPTPDVHVSESYDPETDDSETDDSEPEPEPGV